MCAREPATSRAPQPASEEHAIGHRQQQEHERAVGAEHVPGGYEEDEGDQAQPAVPAVRVILVARRLAVGQPQSPHVPAHPDEREGGERVDRPVEQQRDRSRAVATQQPRRKRHGRDEQQQDERVAHHDRMGADGPAHQLPMPDPVTGDDVEGQQVGPVAVGVGGERVPQRVIPGMSAEVGNLQIERQQGHRDREDAIGQGQQAPQRVVRDVPGAGRLA